MQNTEMKAIIKQCFENIYVIARQDVKKHFKDDKKRGTQWDVARSLVFLRDVAKNPDKYFAPEYTNAAWDARVDEYIKTSGLSDVQIKKYGIKYVRSLTKGSLVEQPFSVVFNKVYPVFQEKGLYAFCEMVQDFYYQDFFKNVYVSESGIREYAEQIEKWANVARSGNCITRGIKKQIYGAYERSM